MNSDFLQQIRAKKPAQRNTSVLIVDDDPAVIRSLEGILKLAELDCSSVQGGYAALDELKHNSYDLVLLDLKMPDLDGTAVLRHIISNNIDTNVIIVSGETEMKRAIDVLKNGARDYIRKPYTTDELLFSINNVLEKVKLERDNREMLEQLEESEALHKFIVHNSPDLLYMLDCKGRFVFVNKNTTTLLGYNRNEIIGKHFTEVVYPKDVERAKLFFNGSLVSKSSKNLELRLQGKNSSSLIHVEIRSIYIEKKLAGGYKLGRKADDTTNFIGSYGVARDITERKRSEEIIRYQYNHDLLTGLPNRTLLNEQMETLINHTYASQGKFAVLFIDINRFKLINDTYGQNVGDALLQNLSDSLRHSIREGDTLARLGGDEFILLLPDIDSPEDAISVAEKVVRETSIPFQYNGFQIHVTLSVGIALYPEHGTNGDSLIKAADIAVCNAKTKSQSRYYLYHSALKDNSSTKVFVENLIRDSIENDRFVVQYQPQINLYRGEIHAAEALVRILSPNRKLILPGKFIDVAEETALINDIGNIVLEKVCRDVQNWNRQGIHLQISINISAVQLAAENFAENLLERIQLYGLNPNEFEIELTENVLVQNMSKAISNLLKVNQAGVKVAIDDFGTGYSSLTYLDRLPLNTLKLDKSFMRKITEETAEDSIIPAIIGVAKGLKLNFIAEGVENQAQHNYLKTQGNCIVQGFYYCKPLGSEQLLRFIEHHSKTLTS